MHNRDQIFKTEISESISQFQLILSFYGIQSTQNLVTHPHNHPDLRRNSSLIHFITPNIVPLSVTTSINKKSVGIDQIPSMTQKKYALVVSTFLSPIVNNCFLNTHFPIDPVSASMIPIPKKNENSLYPDNYRSTSVLSSSSRYQLEYSNYSLPPRPKKTFRLHGRIAKLICNPSEIMNFHPQFPAA